MADELTLGDLVAWGRDWEQHLEAGPNGQGFNVPWTVLHRYVTAANAALAQQQQHEQKREKLRSRGGRPRGGMGEQKMRLVASGVREEDADRIVMHAFGKPLEAVQRAYDSARKKPRR